MKLIITRPDDFDPMLAALEKYAAIIRTTDWQAQWLDLNEEDLSAYVLAHNVITIIDEDEYGLFHKHFEEPEDPLIVIDGILHDRGISNKMSMSTFHAMGNNQDGPIANFWKGDPDAERLKFLAGELSRLKVDRAPTADLMPLIREAQTLGDLNI